MEEEKQDNTHNNVSKTKKDGWEIFKIISSFLIPLSIAFIGWYFTNQHNQNQLDIALVNSSVGQSALIKDFIPHLNSIDSTEKNIAMIAVLYAAPAPGKEIVELLSKSDNEQEKNYAENALASKRKDLASKLFSFKKEIRLLAANEILSSWTNDSTMIQELINKSKSCLVIENTLMDCSNGVYNSLIVLNNFPELLLIKFKDEILKLIDLIPSSQISTKNQGRLLINKLN